MKKSTSKAAANARKRLFILDDHPMMREGLARLIENEMDLVICGEAGSGNEVMEVVGKAKPDLLLADISLPGRNGLEIIKDLRALYPNLPVLVISMHDEGLYAERVLRAGGRGYVMKHEGGGKLLAAIRQVLSGRIYLSEAMSSRVLESISSSAGEGTPHGPLESLSDREFEVLQLLGQGRGTREIAVQLRLSVKTVDAHRANLKRKLKLRTGPELVRYAVRYVEGQ